MKSAIKTTILALFLSSCGAINVDMRTTKTATSPAIFSSAISDLGFSHWVVGKVLRVNGKEIDPDKLPSKILLNPGKYEIEMAWYGTRPPLTPGNTNHAPKSLIEGAGLRQQWTSSEKTFILKLRVREGYFYFVNLEENIIKKVGYRRPNKLCVSEIKQSNKKVKIAPSGNFSTTSGISVISCSK